MNGRRSWQAIMAILCAAAIGLGGCGEPQPSYQQYMGEGAREYDAGHHAEALAMFKQAAEIDPERSEPSYRIGYCYLAMADVQFVQDDMPGAARYCDRAIAAFDKAIAAFPGFGEAVTGKAHALRLRGKHEAAVEIAKWVAAQAAFEAKKLILEARQQIAAGDMDAAQLSFVQAAAIEPDNARVHAEAGMFYLRLKNKAEAIRSLQRAYELEPGAPGIFATLKELRAVPAYPRDRAKRSGP